MSGQSSPPHQPNLAAILQTLSSFTRNEAVPGTSAIDPNQDGNHDNTSYRYAHTGNSAVEDEADYDPASISLTTMSVDSEAPEAVNTARVIKATYEAGEKASQPTLQARYLPLDDQQKITTWPAALRFTTRLLHESPVVEQRLRALIKNQHLNERQWWDGRVELVRAQKARVEGRAQIQEVLKSIGAPVSGSTSPFEDEAQRIQDETDELRAYDLKVRMLMNKVAREQEKSLAAMAVPFFGLPEETKSILSIEDLASLQSRMLRFLEDYVKD